MPDKPTKPVDYRGGLFHFPGSDVGRRLNIGEMVRRHSDGKVGCIRDLNEGNYVFRYYVDFGDGQQVSCPTDAIEPCDLPPGREYVGVRDYYDV
jgi:hypothetical protein